MIRGGGLKAAIINFTGHEACLPVESLTNLMFEAETNKQTKKNIMIMLPRHQIKPTSTIIIIIISKITVWALLYGS